MIIVCDISVRSSHHDHGHHTTKEEEDHQRVYDWELVDLAIDHKKVYVSHRGAHFVLLSSYYLLSASLNVEVSDWRHLEHQNQNSQRKIRWQHDFGCSMASQESNSIRHPCLPVLSIKQKSGFTVLWNWIFWVRYCRALSTQHHRVSPIENCMVYIHCFGMGWTERIDRWIQASGFCPGDTSMAASSAPSWFLEHWRLCSDRLSKLRVSVISGTTGSRFPPVATIGHWHKNLDSLTSIRHQLQWAPS